MHDGSSTSRHRRESPFSHRRRSWCCSFAVPPHSPESYHDSGKSRHSFSTYSKNLHHYPATPKKNELPQQKSSQSSFPNSPQSQASTTSSSKLGLRRILSPGRVSPIDEPAPVAAKSVPKPSSTEIPRSPLREYLDADARASSAADEGSLGNFDVRLSLKARNGGGSLILELSSAVLSSNSAVFARLIADYRRNSTGFCRIEVPEVENLNTFRETVELMFEEKIPEKLLNLGVRRTIDILEVAASIKFSRGVLSCLKFLEAVPWSEEEEEKLRILFTKFKFDDATSKDIMARLYGLESENSPQTLVKQLLWSITTCVDTNAGNELKSLVKGLLSKSSVYEKDYDVNRGDVLAVCQSSLDSLLNLFEEASATGTSPNEKLVKIEKTKPLIERISKHVENINWLLEILIDHQMAEGMVDMWADQKELLSMHNCVSPMIRYELSRVSAMLFIAMGNRKVHCCSETRLTFVQAWFRPMLLDFGWLQRCKKGLDMKVLEEAMGQALLTLPLKEQYQLFMDWFSFFSKQGSECPNLSKAFQVWWRRSFVRGSDSFGIESR
ncbi:OLC1v1008597C1 [Oldenlandia corymbosa var. corymbosa]|uniref:OLC1v1008597C1 n=1 Tax=Oldenlandia corymbosa var. corymbosa TaxID=529605 RepID=A0AAV1DPG1_OLDCO|nr:OLC1v1008597C1 [Oldenlandia corymbosa var. corymbosa]